jgi:flagellar protein FlaG
MDISATKPSVMLNSYSSKDSVESSSSLSGSKSTMPLSETPKNQMEKQEKDEKKLTREDVNQLTEHLNKFMKSVNTDLQFELHEETKRMMVRFVDRKDQHVIKEFPPHELLDTLAAIRDYVGILLDKKV